MNAQRRRGVWLVIAGAIAALALGVATTISLAAIGAFRGPAPAGWTGPGARCSRPPSLAGQVVDVTVGDMGGMMHSMMGTPRGHVPPGGGPGGYGMGMMWLRAAPRSVPAGTVSLRVVNAGALTHEVVVLPLRAGQAVGERPVGSDGKVSEAGSLGEASRSCRGGAGDGITSGATGWTTLALRPGRYELVCNLPGHYAAGMYDELDVAGW
ncbi:sulfocyanin-like copper-binding protein [Streptomyces sp. NPDC058442]|uniref:sulfocyanin-like copper-binding protein n=1 Tax=Streptomyces sp. NPDC058442 TaxID=3346503 RepID=UPI00365FBC2E